MIKMLLILGFSLNQDSFRSLTQQNFFISYLRSDFARPTRLKLLFSLKAVQIAMLMLNMLMLSNAYTY